MSFFLYVAYSQMRSKKQQHLGGRDSWKTKRNASTTNALNVKRFVRNRLHWSFAMVIPVKPRRRCEEINLLRNSKNIGSACFDDFLLLFHVLGKVKHVRLHYDLLLLLFFLCYLMTPNKALKIKRWKM